MVKIGLIGAAPATRSETFSEIRRLLENIDINRLTPVEALMKLNEVKNLLK